MGVKVDKKELLEKFFKYIVITIIFGIVICSIAYLYNAQKMDVSFVKDVYSILFSIFAPLFAIYLFADWKEEYNKQILKEATFKIVNHLSELQTELLELEKFVGHFRNKYTKYKNTPDEHTILKACHDNYINQFNIILDIRDKINIEFPVFLLMYRGKDCITLIREFNKVFQEISKVHDYLIQGYVSFGIIPNEIIAHNMQITNDKFPPLAFQITEKLIEPITSNMFAK